MRRFEILCRFGRAVKRKQTFTDFLENVAVLSPFGFEFY